MQLFSTHFTFTQMLQDSWTTSPEEGRLCPGAAAPSQSLATPPQTQSGRPAPGVAEPGAPLAPSTHKTVIVSCLACPAPPSPPPAAAPHDEAAPDAAAAVDPDAADQAAQAALTGVSKVGILLAYWKCSYPMTPHVRLLVGRGWLVGLSVGCFFIVS